MHMIFAFSVLRTLFNSYTVIRVLRQATTNQNQGLKKLNDGYVRRNHTVYLYATLHRPSASIDHLHHGIFVFRSALLPKASARPRMEVRGERSEAVKSLRTSLARRIELVAAGRVVWRGGGSTLCSKYDLINGAAKSV